MLFSYASTAVGEGNNFDVHSSIKIIVPEALGLLKDSCATAPRIPQVPEKRKLKKAIAFS